jgi:ribosomal protein S12 methylthiotransferase accessory factor
VTHKTFLLGTHRAITPGATLARIAPLTAQLGITRVADLTGLDRVGIPVVAAYRPDARSVAVSLGKGPTLAAARASALMESIELWHAEHPLLERHWGTADELGTKWRLADWRRLAMNGIGFDAATPTAWVEATSMLDGEPLLLPFETVHTDGSVPEPAGSGWFLCTSNGLASGNHEAEAQVHALCELVERDAITLWRTRDVGAATVITLRTVTHPLCRALIERFEIAGLSVLLHDATTDIGLPVVLCTVFDERAEPALQMGMGCHPSRDVAISRALTEAAQSRLTLISGARDDLFREKYEAPRDGADLVRQFKAWADAARDPNRSVDVERLPDLATDSLEDDREVIVARLRVRGLHPSWVCLTQPEFGIPVGRAVVPGLEPPSDLAAYCPGARARDALASRCLA